MTSVTTVTLSAAGVSLILAEQELANIERESRRWRARRNEAEQAIADISARRAQIVANIERIMRDMPCSI